MAHDTHHDDHGHDNLGTPQPHAGYFEVAMALGALIWVFVILLINLNCWGPNTICEDDECCAPGGEHKTEAPAEHH